MTDPFVVPALLRDWRFAAGPVVQIGYRHSQIAGLRHSVVVNRCFVAPAGPGIAVVVLPVIAVVVRHAAAVVWLAGAA